MAADQDGGNTALEIISRLLGHNGNLDKQDAKDLQAALNDAGYHENFQKHGADGAIRRMTSRDIVALLQDHPDMIAGLGQPMRKLLINNGFGSELAAIVRDNPPVQEQLKIEARNVVGDRALDSLSSGELEQAQAAWSLLGIYPSGRKVDGQIGEGTRLAYRDYSAGDIPAAKEEPAVAENSSMPPEDHPHPDEEAPLPEQDETDTNGFGVPNEVIDHSWKMVEGRPVGGRIIEAAQTGRPLVVIDPGHGGSDGGAHANGVKETEIIDPVARHLAADLYRKGYDVAFTRQPGEKLPYEPSGKGVSPLVARAQFGHMLADQMGSGHVYFISLHADSHPNRNMKGAFVYAASASNHDEEVDFGRPAIDQSSVELSEKIAGHLKDAKSWTADPTVIRAFDEQGGRPGQKSAAVLIELGYITNEHEAGYMKKNPGAMAAQIADGIDRYHRYAAEETRVADAGGAAPAPVTRPSGPTG